MSKATKKELEEHRKKLVVDLVEFAYEWKKLRGGITIAASALQTFVTLDTMADIVLEKFTASREEPANEKPEKAAD